MFQTVVFHGCRGLSLPHDTEDTNLKGKTCFQWHLCAQGTDAYPTLRNRNLVVRICVQIGKPGVFHIGMQEELSNQFPVLAGKRLTFKDLNTVLVTGGPSRPEFPHCPTPASSFPSSKMLFSLSYDWMLTTWAKHKLQMVYQHVGRTIEPHSGEG